MVVEMSRASFDTASMVVDGHCISYHSELFQRDEGRGADLLWATQGSGYIDIATATAHELEHSNWWEYEFTPTDGTLRKKDGFYRAFLHNGANLYETVVEIPAYYID